jgi:hypothetical protein
MKKLINKYKGIALLAIITLALLPRTGLAQNEKDEKTAAISNMVATRNYVFKAQTAMPSTGTTRQLTNDFDLQVSKDTIISDLPYFGRTYTVPINPSESPLRFTSTKFEYAVSNKKKGGWNINITPKDVQAPSQLTLTIFDNGSASLTVTSYNRSSISFTGYVTDKK